MFINGVRIKLKKNYKIKSFLFLKVLENKKNGIYI